VPVDNELYDRLRHWWEEDGFLNIFKRGLTPRPAFGYMRRVLTETLGLEARGLQVLDVGCGGGLPETGEM
jgi:2-polyprenyl-3-methyl-5-hydroxy-6-metoxy-1,4-benzoquinol methylase